MPRRRNDISTAWIDYKKAYDSVPHNWIVESLTIHKFDPTITNFIKLTMKNLRSGYGYRKKFSDDIRMAFGFDKCNKLTVKKGKIIQSELITMEDDQQLNP